MDTNLGLITQSSPVMVNFEEACGIRETAPVPKPATMPLLSLGIVGSELIDIDHSMQRPDNNRKNYGEENCYAKRKGVYSH
jgi:hypothetical protein